MKRWRIYVLVFPLMMIMASVFAQDQNAALGNEYYLKGDYEKAIAYYEKYLKTGKDPFLVYDNYYQALIGSKELSRAEKEIKKLSKKENSIIEWAGYFQLPRLLHSNNAPMLKV